MELKCEHLIEKFENGVTIKKYKLGKYNITSSMSKPSEKAMEEFRRSWHKLFEKKMREHFLRQEGDL